MVIFGIIMIVVLSMANLVNVPTTIHLVLEQIKMGWGYGTNMDIAVLWPWMLEILCAPVVIAGAVYFVVSILKKNSGAILIANVVLYVFLVLQYIITNLFIWY